MKKLPANLLAFADALVVLADCPSSKRKRFKYARKLMRKLRKRHGFRVVPVYRD